SARTPRREQRRWVGLSPPAAGTPAGGRIDPPVSAAVPPRQSLAATAAAEPPEEPPGTRSTFEPRRRQGFTAGPKCECSFEEPIADSSLLSLASITAPSRQRLAGSGE